MPQVKEEGDEIGVRWDLGSAPQGTGQGTASSCARGGLGEFLHGKSGQALEESAQGGLEVSKDHLDVALVTRWHGLDSMNLEGFSYLDEPEGRNST